MPSYHYTEYSAILFDKVDSSVYDSKNIKTLQGGRTQSLSALSVVKTSLPKFIDEWDDDSSYFRIDVFNPDSVSRYAKFHTSIGVANTDSILFENSWDIHIDTFLPGSNIFTFERFCPEFYSIYWDNFVEHYDANGGMDTGSYFFIFELRDTTFESIIYKDSLTFRISDTTSASCLWPFDNTKIYSGYLDSLYFTWSPTSTAANVDYVLEVFQILPGKNEYYAVDSSPYIYQQLFSDTLCFSPTLNALLTPGSQYAWRIRTKLNGTNYHTGNMHGKSIPFVFTVTNNEADSGYKIYKTDPCSFGGFETGTFDGWKGSKGIHYKNDVWNKNKFELNQDGIDASGHQIFPVAENDEIADFINLKKGPEDGGNFAARIGDFTTNGSYCYSIRKSFTVTKGNAKFTVRMAAVLQNPSHKEDEQPIAVFRVYTQKDYKKRRLIKVTGKAYASGFHQAMVKDPNSDVEALPWNCFNVDLTKYRGKTVTIEYITSDCSLGDHYGYGYFDVCGNPEAESEVTTTKSIYCVSEEIIADGTSSRKESEFKWELLGSNAESEDIYLMNEHQQYGEAGYLNLTLFSGGNLSCNTWYKVKLYVRNDCSDWDVSEKLFKVQCPETDHIPDYYCCPSFNCNIQLGGNAIAGYSYEWGPEYLRNCLNSYTISDPEFTSSCMLLTPVMGYPLELTVLITDDVGCTAEKTIYIYGDPPVDTIEVDTICCGLILKSIGGSTKKNRFSWYITSISSNNFISHDEQITVSPSTSTVYILKLENGCGNKTTSITVSPQSVKKGNIDTLTFTNGVHHDEDFIISYVNASNPNSKYNATKWAIYYLGRWGHTDWTEADGPVASGVNCDGFSNGTVRWDCKINGTRVTPGAHNIRVVLTNCDLPNNTKYQAVNCTTTPYILKNLKYECMGKIDGWVWNFYKFHVPYNGLEKCTCYNYDSHADLCKNADKDSKKWFIFPSGMCICKKHKVAAACQVPNIEVSKTCMVIYID